MMRFLPILFLLVSCSGFTQQKNKDVTTLILVRHAEKMDDGTRDPELSAAGKERTQALVDLLSETDVHAIYTTPYKRTRETVAPLATAKGITLKEYTPKDEKALLEIIAAHTGKTIVMVGHSNTTPWVANVLIGEDKFPDWKDDDYNNVLIVSVFNEGTAVVTWLTYGKANH